MEYQVRNYILLQGLYDLISKYPLNTEDEKQLNKIDLELISKVYHPYMDIDNDVVALAICWSASTLRTLIDGDSVKDLNDFSVFVDTILTNNSVIYNSYNYGVRCKGFVSHETTSFYTIDISEIEIDGVWVNFNKFKEIISKVSLKNDIVTYEVVEKTEIKPFDYSND